VIFHESKSAQAAAIREITGLRYTHCGIIVNRDDRLHVAEAINPVPVIATREFPVFTIEDWIARAVDQHAVIKRLLRRASIGAGRASRNKRSETA
jgi:hypothetical protein